MKKGRLIIMRHGETEYNADGRMTGHANAKLTKEGVEQGRRTGYVLRKFDIDIAYASPLDRAKQTLELGLEFANAHNNLKNKDGSWKLEIRESLIEKSVGDYTGFYKTDKRVTSLKRDFNSRLPNGESDKEVVARLKKLYEEELLPLMEEGKTVVISCHSVVKRMFHLVIGECEYQDLYKFKVPNAQPWVIDFENGQRVSSKYYNPAEFIANDNKGLANKQSKKQFK